MSINGCNKYYTVDMDIHMLNTLLERIPLKNTILEFLKTFYINKNDLSQYRGIYLYGTSGIGKTAFIRGILTKYDIIYYNASDVRNKNVITSITKHNMSNKNVLSMFHKKTRPIVIVMDEVDNMNQGDKGGINLLLKLIRGKKTKKQRLEEISSNPIICIGNYQNDKKMNELKKSCLSLEMTSPTTVQLNKLLKYYLPNITYELLHKLSLKISNLNHLSMCIDIYHNDPTLLPIIINNDICCTNHYNIDTKETTNQLLTNEHHIKDHQCFINEQDRTIIALLLHENMIDLLEKHPKKTTMPLYLNILENICFADYVDRITFQRQIWQFNEMSSLLKNTYSSFLLKEYKTKLKDIRFTKILTKYSTEFNNRMFIQSLSQELVMDKKDLFGYFYMLLKQNDHNILSIFEHSSITKLDINRIIRYIEQIYHASLTYL